MSGERKTAIVTGCSQGIGACLVKAFLERGYNVVANSRKITKSGASEASDEVALVDGNIAEPATAARVVETALSRFKSIDALVNNAGIFFTKPFTDYTVEDLKSLVSTNVEGFLYVTQLSIKQMLAQKTGGSTSANGKTDGNSNGNTRKCSLRQRRATVKRTWHQASDATSAVRHLCGSGADGRSAFSYRDASHRRTQREIHWTRRRRTRCGSGTQSSSPRGAQRPRCRQAAFGIA